MSFPPSPNSLTSCQLYTLTLWHFDTLASVELLLAHLWRLPGHQLHGQYSQGLGHQQVGHLVPGLRLLFSFYPSVSVSLHVFVSLIICLSAPLKICFSLSLYLSLCLSLSLFMSVYAYLTICLSIRRVFLSICLPVSVCLSVCLSLCLSVYFSFFLSLSLPFSLLFFFLSQDWTILEYVFFFSVSTYIKKNLHFLSDGSNYAFNSSLDIDDRINRWYSCVLKAHQYYSFWDFLFIQCMWILHWPDWITDLLTYCRFASHS